MTLCNYSTIYHGETMGRNGSQLGREGSGFLVEVLKMAIHFSRRDIKKADG